MSWGEARGTNIMQHLQKFKDYIEEKSAEWNGDESGILEDQAHICKDILEKVAEIEVLMTEFNSF